jgi:glutamine amidotransferase
MVIIINYGMGNLGSIVNMFKKIGVTAKVSSTEEDITTAERIVLPGVGAFDTGMARLNELGLIPLLNENIIKREVPVLGLCLGMQLITRGSEEGNQPGLGWIAADTIRFRFDPKSNGLKIPHMGWNTVRVMSSHKLFNQLTEDARFYFVHSYHVVCDHPENILAYTEHGYEFASAIQCGNVMGVQFHPEKSHRFGMQLLRNFMEI